MVITRGQGVFRIYIFLVTFFGTMFSVRAQETTIKYLSGTGNDDTVPWEFYCSEGMNSKKWTTIPVPSCWELQGFGSYNYGIDPWEERMNEHGIYRHEFSTPKAWGGKKVNIVFEGVMTDAHIKINGKSLGPVHQGAFYEFKHDVGKLLHYGDKPNLLEVTVFKHSSDSLVNEAERWADYWIFGGIFRPVYIEVLPANHLERVATDARANGDFKADVHYKSHEAVFLGVELQDLSGTKIAGLELEIQKPNNGLVRVADQFKDIQAWNPEFPKLYNVVFSLKDKNRKILHQTKVRTGFRTVEVKEKDGIYVNGVKIKFKGISRHVFWPTSGRTTNKRISISDVKLIKEMNMNAVRMSHYPPDKHFLDACDSLGLFVFNELGGWGPPAYGTEIGKKLVREMVLRDENHPSILFWGNGNEGGWNPDLDDEFLLYDIQERETIRPRQIFRNINTLHYFKYNYLAYDSYQQDKIFLTTEFLHGCWDEGHGAALDDYWSLMWENPICAGGFLWNFSDEAVVRTDRNNMLDVDGNHAADGITGPAREKEGSFYTVKEIWAPVHFEEKFITSSFDGKFEIENRYHYTNLNQCAFEASWIKFRGPRDHETTPLSLKETNIPQINLKPGEKGILSVDVPNDWNTYDALYIKAMDPEGNEIFTWSFPLKGPDEIIHEFDKAKNNDVSADETSQSILVHTENNSFEFDKKTGTLAKAYSNRKELPLNNGPRFITKREIALSGISHYKDDAGHYIIEFSFQGEITKFRNIQYKIRWTARNDGLLDLDVSGHYMQGITFDYPEEKIKSVRRLGDGPFRVWRNRMKGTTLGVWEDDYNNTITGDPASMYDYPEFKGFYSSLYWATLINKDQNDMTVYCHTPYTFLRLFTPETSPAVREGWGTDELKLNYPEGDISFLNAIPPIGTMFKKAADLGPQSQLETVYGWDSEPVTMKFTFDFKTEVK